VPKQPMLGIRRAQGARIEAYRAGTKAGITKLGFQEAAVISAGPLIGVDIEDPLACDLVYCVVARRRKMIIPLAIDATTAVSSCNLTAAVAGPISTTATSSTIPTLDCRQAPMWGSSSRMITAAEINVPPCVSSICFVHPRIA
jgi:hypothetical protein